MTYGKLNQATFACDICAGEGSFDNYATDCAACGLELCTGCCFSCGECGLELCRECIVAIPTQGHIHMNDYFCAACSGKRLAVAA
jgi:hypothetical protein